MKTIDELRTMLAEVITEVRCGKLDIDRAKTVNELSRSIIDTAKVEVEYARHADTQVSCFITGDDARALPSATPGNQHKSHRAERTITESPGVRRIVNRL